MKKIITGLLSLFACLSSFAQAGDLPAGYLGSVLNYSWGTQTYNYSFTPTTTGVDYVGFAFRQDPGFWTFTNPVVTAGNSSTNLLINGNLQYGGSLTVNTSNYGQMYIQAPSDWGVWYQNGTYPGAAGYWSPGQWYDGAVGSYDGIYQGISVRAGTTYNISFSLSGTNPSSNPSIEVGTYMGTCAAGTNIFTCVPNSSASMSAIAAPQATQSVGGAPPPPPPAPSGPQFTDLKFSGNQIADTQWNVGSCTNASGTNCQIYSKSPGPTYNLGYPVYPTSTQYIAFTATGDSTNPWHMWLYNSDGSVARDLGVGHILSEGLGSDGHHYFFFSNSNFNGTLFSTDWGMNNTAGVTINGTNNPTVTQTNDFASTGSTTPLASGATAGGGNAPPTVTSTNTVDSSSSSSSIGSVSTTTNQYNWNNQIYTVTGTATPTITVITTTPVTTTNWSDGTTTTTNGSSTTTTTTTWSYNVSGPAHAPVNPNANTNTNSVYITQVNAGANDRVNADQSGHGNYESISLGGSNNTINAGQGYTYNSLGIASESLTSSSYNLLGLSVSGNSNTVTTSQIGLTNSAIINVSGNTNTATVNQTGNNNQAYNLLNGNNNTSTIIQSGNTNLAAVNLYGDGNNASVSQTGNGHGVVISLTNAGGPNTATVVQTGTGDAYSLQQTCTNPSGCSVGVIRNR